MTGARGERRERARARRNLAAAVLALAGTLGTGSAPVPAQAQLRVGGQASFANEVLGGTLGVGPRVEFGAPAFPVRLAASFDYFFPNCPQCRYWETNVNALVSLPLLPIPFFRHVGGGWHMQSVKANPFDDPRRASGVNAVLGMGAERTNVEARYEILKDVEDQLVLSFALFFL